MSRLPGNATARRTAKTETTNPLLVRREFATTCTSARTTIACCPPGSATATTIAAMDLTKTCVTTTVRKTNSNAKATENASLTPSSATGTRIAPTVRMKPTTCAVSLRSTFVDHVSLSLFPF